MERVTFFTMYPFAVGEKIHINDGPRRGDWLVADLTERKVKLRCPVSGREFDWDRFCYVVDTREAVFPDIRIEEEHG